MFSSTFAVVVGAVLVLSGPPLEKQAAPETLRTRLADFEKRQPKGAEAAKELESLSRDVLSDVVAKAKIDAADAVVAACESDLRSDADACVTRLRALADGAGVALRHRIAAAATLVPLKDAGAEKRLLALAGGAPAAELAAAAPSLRVLPAERSVPILARLLDSENEGARTQACHVLGSIDAFESRQAIQAFLDKSPRGTPPWFACTVAAAELGDQAAQRTVGPIANYLRGMELVLAADPILRLDLEHGIAILEQVSRECRGIVCLEAADRLVAHRPDVARAAVAEGLQSREPEIRAGALVVFGQFKVEPTTAVRALLVDPAPLVRVRAAQVVSDWARRTRAE